MATEGRLRDYSGGFSQIDDEIEEKLNSRFFFQILLSAYWSVGLTCRICAVFLFSYWWHEKTA